MDEANSYFSAKNVKNSAVMFFKWISQHDVSVIIFKSKHIHNQVTDTSFHSSDPLATKDQFEWEPAVWTLDVVDSAQMKAYGMLMKKWSLICRLGHLFRQFLLWALSTTSVHQESILIEMDTSIVKWISEISSHFLCKKRLTDVVYCSKKAYRMLI